MSKKKDDNPIQHLLYNILIPVYFYIVYYIKILQEYLHCILNIEIDPIFIKLLVTFTLKIKVAPCCQNYVVPIVY